MDDAVFLLEGRAYLQKEYCPPIDTALFSAIVSDYDLSDPLSIDEVRPILDALKESADAEGTAEFDPSGSSGLHYGGSALESPDRARSWHGEEGSRSEETDLSSLSQSIEMLDIAPFMGFETEQHEGEHGKGYDKGLDELSPADKEDLLREMFPTTKAFDISYALKKNECHFGRTVEELLNHVFFKEAQEGDGDGHIVTKGIDAFIEGADGTRGRKARARRRKQTKLQRRTSSTPAPLADSSTNSPSSSSTSPILSSKWDLAKQDVEFITQRTYLSPQTVSSQYHKSGASLPHTISALCASSPPPENPYIPNPTDPVLDLHASELATHFPRIPPSHIHALIHLTHPSTASAHDLARAMTTAPTPTHTAIQLIPLYQRPDLSSPPDPPPSHPHTPLSYPSALALASTYTAARTAAFAHASAAYRKSRSTPLMSGAASHYARSGRAAAASAAKYTAAAADALAAQQSSESEVDLHGLGVRDAVRIARERVQAWWEASARAEWLGTRKAAGGGEFRVVTGVGRHSEGGRARLGPAVGGMLTREGWKVEVGTGVLVVSGRARK